MLNPIKISISNQSTLFKDIDLPALANALQIQVARDFFPAWGVTAEIFYTPTGAHPTADHWVLALLDDADQAGALGYHDVTPAGLPLGKAFVRTTQADGGQISVTVSHELLEMLGDPQINLAAQDGNIFWGYEVADAVESDADGYEITIPAGWAGAGAKVLVSDFVYPSWFETFRTVGPFDFGTKLTAALELSPGGYISFLDLNNLALGWQQKNARLASDAYRVRSRPHVGSRRARRAMPRYEWVRSTYAPGSEALPTNVGLWMTPL